MSGHSIAWVMGWQAGLLCGIGLSWVVVTVYDLLRLAKGKRRG